MTLTTPKRVLCWLMSMVGFTACGDSSPGHEPTATLDTAAVTSSTTGTPGGVDETSSTADGTTGGPETGATTDSGLDSSDGSSTTSDDVTQGIDSDDTSSDGSSSSTGSTAEVCPDTMGTSIVGGPVDLYGFCWYLTAGGDTCDLACAELGGTNLALEADASFDDTCQGPAPHDVTTWFFENGNPAGWTHTGGATVGRTLGYGYTEVGTFYGKCSTGTIQVGTYPGEIQNGGALDDQRQPVCPCFHGLRG